MSNGIRSTIEMYGRNMGLHHVNPDLFAFSFENGELVTLDNRNDSLAVSLSTVWPEYELDRAMEIALSMVSYMATPEYQIMPGLRGDNCLVLSVFLNSQVLSLSTLDSAVGRLRLLSQELDTRVRG